MTDDDRAADMPRIERRRGLSLAWLAPVLAVVIAGGVAWRHYAALGPTIEIVLATAAGVEAGRTPIRHRDVEIGRVETLHFEADMTRVVAVARMSADVAPWLTDAATFWLVRPVVSPTEISGLETLLSGAYLGVDLGENRGAPTRRFEALDAPPPTPPGAAGRRLTLRADDGAALVPGSPVTFKGVEVGRVETRRFSEDGSAVLFDLFVAAPHDARIGPQTRFWDVGGVSFALGADGVQVGVGSLASLLRGGVAFDVVPGAPAHPEGAPLTLYASAADAAESLIEEGESGFLRFDAAFSGSVRGLSPGAPVEYRGVQVGVVEFLSIEPGATLEATRIVATLRLQPRRIGLSAEGREAQLAFFARSVESGLRARLASGNLLTGALYVEFVDAPDSARQTLDLDAQPRPRIPTVPATLDALQAGAQDALRRLADLPLEEVVASVIAALDSVTRLASNPELKAAPATLNRALASAATLLETLESRDAAGRVADAADAAGGAAASLAEAAESLPQLSRRLDALLGTLEGVAAAYGAGSPLNSEALATLREARQAARSIATLAQTLERRPNSLILGR
jgi:paraquat-inducible protein B